MDTPRGMSSFWPSSTLDAEEVETRALNYCTSMQFPVGWPWLSQEWRNRLTTNRSRGANSGGHAAPNAVADNIYRIKHVPGGFSGHTNEAAVGYQLNPLRPPLPLRQFPVSRLNVPAVALRGRQGGAMRVAQQFARAHCDRQMMKG